VILPNRLVIGAMRSGTTWVHEYLAARSDVMLPSGTKETYFFDRSFDKGAAWYAKHFPVGSQRPPFVIEVGPSYLHAADAPARVMKTLGQVPLVVIARNPVLRSWSHYVHLKRFGLCPGELRAAAKANPEILDASRYAYQLRRWGAVMGRSPSLVSFEVLAESPVEFASAICAALDMPFVAANAETIGTSNANVAPSSPRLASLGAHVSYFLRDRRMYGVIEFAKKLGLQRLVYGATGPGKPPEKPSPDEGDWLARQLDSDIDELQGLIGRDLGHWRMA
jgi:hypothetical protein